jgi:hypothetical protein
MVFFDRVGFIFEELSTTIFELYKASAIVWFEEFYTHKVLKTLQKNHNNYKFITF